jgi:3-hydroxyacyl-[acyl-carrier-protein] dehydratase
VKGKIEMLDKEQIKEIIPQREPFLMIDEVEQYIPGESCTAYKYVNKDEYYFKGHFPGNPIMPGVLMVEALAQTGAVAILSMEENKGKNALFGGINNLKFKKQVVPGDTLKLEVKIIKRKGPIGIGEAIATVDGKVAVKGELTFAIV